jgi:hypothetical protein
MFRITTKSLGRVAVAALLSAGLTAGTVGVASASSRHNNDQSTQSEGNFVAGTVSSYAAGTSIAVTPKGATSPTTYTLNSSTAISGLQSGATIASPDFVVLELSASTPVTVTAIRVFAPQSGNGWGSGDQSPGGSSNRGGFGGPGAQHSGGFGGRDSHNGGRGNHGFARNGNFRK